MEHARSECAKVCEDEFDACRQAVQCCVVARESETRGGRVERNDYKQRQRGREEGRRLKASHIISRAKRGQYRTAFARPRKGDRIATDAAEGVEDNVAPTPLRYLGRDRLGRHAVPPLLV